MLDVRQIEQKVTWQGSQSVSEILCLFACLFICFIFSFFFTHFFFLSFFLQCVFVSVLLWFGLVCLFPFFLGGGGVLLRFFPDLYFS